MYIGKFRSHVGICVPQVIPGTLWLVGIVFMWFYGRERREPSLSGKKQARSPKDLDVQTQSLQTAFASEQAAHVFVLFLSSFMERSEESIFHGYLCIDVND